MSSRALVASLFCFSFFNDTATTEIYTLSLHDALPICERASRPGGEAGRCRHGFIHQPVIGDHGAQKAPALGLDRKSTRLNSSHVRISYAVFCLKKKKNEQRTRRAIALSTNLHVYAHRY